MVQIAKISKTLYFWFWAGFLVVSAQAGERQVSVHGSCLRQVVPDRGSLVLTAEIKGSDSRRVSSEAGQIYEKVKERVQRLKLQGLELQTTEYVVEEIREWEKDRMVSRGFRGRIGLKVTTQEHIRLGEVAEIASREGVKEIGRLVMSLSPAKERLERNECLKEAAEQARLKAARLAESLNAKLGEVLSIQEVQTGSHQPPMPMLGMAMDNGAKAMEAAPVIEVGTQELQVSISATFALK